MVIDTSAVIAILLREPDRRYFYDKILNSGSRQISTVSYVEAGMVLHGRSPGATQQALEQMFTEMDIDVVPASLIQAKHALDAFRKFGKGRHPAALNFGDCFSYALAKSTAEPLLFKGNDFAKTDIAAG